MTDIKEIVIPNTKHNRKTAGLGKNASSFADVVEAIFSINLKRAISCSVDQKTAEQKLNFMTV